MAAILVTSSKLATLGHLKIKVFLKEVYDVPNKVLSGSCGHLTKTLATLALMWGKLFFKEFDQKTHSLGERSWFKFNNLRLALDMAFKFNSSVAKGLKINIKKLLGVDFYVSRSYRAKTGRVWMGLSPTQSWTYSNNLF